MSFPSAYPYCRLLFTHNFILCVVNNYCILFHLFVYLWIDVQFAIFPLSAVHCFLFIFSIIFSSVFISFFFHQFPFRCWRLVVVVAMFFTLNFIFTAIVWISTCENPCFYFLLLLLLLLPDTSIREKQLELNALWRIVTNWPRGYHNEFFSVMECISHWWYFSYFVWAEGGLVKLLLKKF